MDLTQTRDNKVDLQNTTTSYRVGKKNKTSTRFTNLGLKYQYMILMLLSLFQFFNLFMSYWTRNKMSYSVHHCNLLATLNPAENPDHSG